MPLLCRSYMPVAAVCWLIVTGLIALYPAVLLAHAVLLRAEPAIDTQVAQLPGEIRLWFSESIEHHFSRITVHRAMRQPTTNVLQPQERVDVGLVAGPRVTRALAVKLPETLSPGLYLVQWKVLSIDSHRTMGSFTLTYAPQTLPPREAEGPKSTP